MNKMLSNLLELPAKIDEDIHRQYSKLTKKWEDRGRSRYSLSGIFDIVSYLSATNVGVSRQLDKMGTYANPFLVGMVIGTVVGSSTALSLIGGVFGTHDGTIHKSGKTIVYNPLNYYTNKIGQIIRAPELIVGASMIGKGIFDIGNYLMNNDSSSLSEGWNNLTFGTSLASNASAWYVRDSDPKVLDKKPNWKAGLEKLAEYVSPAQTEPSPIKIPVKY